MRKIAAAPGAAGIAAPQLGCQIRAFALCINKEYPPIFFFNPILKGVSEEMSEVTEGCLSVPGKIAKLQRYNKVKLAWQDEHGKSHNKNGKKYEFEFSGFEAQAVQHELGHLSGELCVDIADELYDAEQFEKAFNEAKAAEVARELEIVSHQLESEIIQISPEKMLMDMGLTGENGE